MAHQPQDLFTVAMNGGTIRRLRDVAVLRLHDLTLTVPARDVNRAQRWGRAIPTSGRADEDRRRLLEELPTLIVHAESGGATRGSDAELTQMARAMRDGGMTVADWKLPAAVLETLAADPLPEEDPAAVPAR